MNHKFSVGVILMILLSGCSPKLPKLIEDAALESQISCTLESKTDSLFVGDHPTIYLIVKNNSNQEIYVDNNSYGLSYRYQRKKNKRDEQFNLRIETENRTQLAPQDGVSMRSGRYGITRIAPLTDLKISINELYNGPLTDKPGRYNIFLDKGLYIYLNQTENDSKDWPYNDYGRRIWTRQQLQLEVRVYPSF